jgi:hypothetical protein
MFGGEVLDSEPGRAINLNRDLIVIDSEKTPGPPASRTRKVY